MRNSFLIFLLVIPFTACVTSSLSYETQYALFKDVTYADYGGGVKLIADIYDPDAADAPVVILVHGGDWNSRSGDMQAIGEDLAKRGFLVYAVTYRFAPQFVYPAQLEDLKNALRFIEADAPARHGDLKNIFVWGYSSGGYLAFMLGLDPENKIKGIVTGAAPVDLTEFPKSAMVTKFLGKTYGQAPKYWSEVSPVNNVRDASPPVFMYHGVEDQIVDVEQMYDMKEKLEEKKIPVTARAVGGVGHVSLYLIDQKSINLGVQFLLDLLKKETAPHGGGRVL